MKKLYKSFDWANGEILNKYFYKKGSVLKSQMIIDKETVIGPRQI